MVSSSALGAQRPGEQVGHAADHPDSARFITDDLRNFTRVLAVLRQGYETDTVAVMTREYFGRATPGLRAYAARYRLTPQDVVAAMRRYPRYYASLSELEPDVSDTHEDIRASYAELKRIHPSADFPPVCFFIGNLGAGGLTRPEGLLVSAELFAATSRTDVTEFTAGLPRVQRIEQLPHIVAHELMHYQQAIAQGLEAYRAIFGERQSLLALAIREGSADFLAALISSGTVYSDVHRFGKARERELWLQFQEDMHRRDPGDWMFSRPAKHNWPMDLGYFMGYRITESFYMSAADKRRAIQDILAVTDYDAFLRASGYAERFQ
ncbi:MAG: hypothetical protein M3373_03455 [Gemmatimonadota bacterium]|nr:hypothetical protein [Gemmatimonadota bacterium]